MSLGILALKVGMTQVFDEKGTAHPVTVLQAGPCPVLQVKTVEKDGYNAVQVGFLDKSRKRSTRAERGHVAADLSSKRRERIKQGGTADTLSAKADCEPQKHIREFRLTEAASVAVGAKLTVGEVFKEGQKVDVIGTTKGRGYSGTMKRWNFAGCPPATAPRRCTARWVAPARWPATAALAGPRRARRCPASTAPSRSPPATCRSSASTPRTMWC